MDEVKYLVISFMVFSSVGFAKNPALNMSEPDKQAHAIVGFCIGLTTQLVLEKYVPEMPFFPRWMSGVLVTMVLGTIKELVIDKGRSDLNDIHAGNLGAASSIVVTLPLEIF